MGAAQCRRLIPLYATGELGKDQGLLRTKPGPTTHEKAPANRGQSWTKFIFSV